MPTNRPSEPWHSFLRDLNERLGEAVQIHCLGGFVATVLYGLPRQTGDVDYIEARSKSQAERLLEIAGRNSPLHQKHWVYLQKVTIVTLPESYAARLRGMFPGAYERIRLYGLDPYDLALSKLERNSMVDRQDVWHLARTVPLDPKILKERYEIEMRPYIGRAERPDTEPVVGGVLSAFVMGGVTPWRATRVLCGVPSGIRTRVAAVKGRCPRPG